MPGLRLLLAALLTDVKSWRGSN